MLLMWTVTTLIGRIEARGVAPLALAAMALMELANLFYGHRRVDDARVHCFNLEQATNAPQRNRHAYSDAQATYEVAGCSGHAVSTAHDPARKGSRSPRQVEMAR